MAIRTFAHRENVFPDPSAFRELARTGWKTRFAPSPTGHLHLGHVLNAIYVWGLAGAWNGKVLLRIEDHDRQRAKPEHETAILWELEQLGLQPKEGPIESFRSGACAFRQSDHPERYRTALEQLTANHCHIFGCDCTRKFLDELVGRVPGQQLVYPGYCRERQLGLKEDAGWRLQIAEETLKFEDLLQGPQEQSPAQQCGDLLLRDKRGNWTYQFAVVVDDLAEGIDLVIRGNDLLDSTGRQLLLRRMLNPASAPLQFMHHPLIRDDKGNKLSKRFLSTSITELLTDEGLAPEEILGRAAWLGKLLPEEQPLSPNQLPRLFRNA